MTTVYLALYKGRKSGGGIKVQLARLADWAVRQATGGIYSHCEIAVAQADGRFACYSASLRDGGVRAKTMPLSEDKWDLIELRQADLLPRINYWFLQTRGAPYDTIGALGVVLPLSGSLKKWFCSEWCAQVLGLPQPETYSPNTLAKHFQAA
ncbi:hypothetical protein V6667_06440 [Neisseria leonii]|uniref:Enoyl-CoA hydratase n=1 Tax=Neisseria leonii TaxID=2995413 RepID=A0A9X4IAS4_9NEIS|nr:MULTISPECIES: hypothetical protein [unclassified Neisseria]MDD9324737.1 hypothetical protein [Neisseria sp. 3986]MDD9327700.1 hypothetical protein [Neisseria sp. 51.81]